MTAHEKYRKMLHKVADMSPAERVERFTEMLNDGKLSTADQMDVESFIENERKRDEQHV